MKPNQNQLSGRTIVGYDVRKPAALGAVHMTSYDEGARYEEIYDLCETHLSGLNLLKVDPSQIPLFALPENGRVIAFDLPTQYVESAAKGNVSVPPMLPWLDPSSGWTFLGFDVVDPRTQLSALLLYLGERAGRAEDEGDSLPINAFGLIDCIETAVSASSTFEGKYPEHVPLVPCGVWLKEQ